MDNEILGLKIDKAVNEKTRSLVETELKPIKEKLDDFMSRQEKENKENEIFKRDITKEVFDMKAEQTELNANVINTMKIFERHAEAQEKYNREARQVKRDDSKLVITVGITLFFSILSSIFMAINTFGGP